MRGIKGFAERLLLKLLYRRRANGSSAELFETRIWGGPLRGMRLSVIARERISYALGSYEKHLLRTMQKHVTPGMVAYDIGANCGYFSLILSELVGPRGKVFAFEADSRNLAALKANMERNGIGNVEVVGKAVSQHTGQVRFASFGYSLVGHIVEQDGVSNGSVRTVDAISLSDFVAEDAGRAPGFIKIDVEGAEEAVFAGAREVLAKYRPVVAAEIRQSAWHPISDWMKGNGYSIGCLDGGWQMERHGLTDAIFLPA